MRIAGNDDPGDEDIARAFIDVQRLLDRIRRGELAASELEEARLRHALEALRSLRRPQSDAA